MTGTWNINVGAGDGLGIPSSDFDERYLFLRLTLMREIVVEDNGPHKQQVSLLRSLNDSEHIRSRCECSMVEWYQYPTPVRE